MLYLQINTVKEITDFRIKVKHLLNNIFVFVGCPYQDVSIPARP